MHFSLLLAEIIELQGDTAEQLMSLANHLSLGIIVAALILGISRVVSAYVSRRP